MAKQPGSPVSYYYAGGQKIQLIPADDLFAVDEPGDRRSETDAAPAGRALTDGLRLVTRDQLGDAVKALDVTSKLKYPVFHSHGAIIVALPEVRVEESRKSRRASLDRWLSKHHDDVTVVSRDDDRVVLTPVSGSGQDALAIANHLTEEVGPEMAQARFIRVAPRPDSSGRKKF